MTYGDDSAMPLIINSGDYTKGLTKRETFAKDAPKQVPDWFVHNSIEKPTIPNIPDNINKEQSDVISGWLRDPCWSLPKELSFFEKSMNDYNISLSKWQQNDLESRYFQWRTYYADRLIEELNKT